MLTEVPALAHAGRMFEVLGSEEVTEWPGAERMFDVVV